MLKLRYTLFYVDDVEKTMNFYAKAFGLEKAFKKAIETGAILASPPTAKPWGQIVSYVRDCNRFLVEICSPME